MLTLFLLLASPSPSPEPLVEVRNIRLDVRYATPNNFTHQKVYPWARCLLRRPTAERLQRVERALAPLHLVLYDCFRPLSVQRRFWQLVPDERYVADPRQGSRHNRGAAVDLGLLDEKGKPLDMGSGFDDFTERSHRDFAGLTGAQRAHRAALDAAMTREGFVPLPTEWWHFDDAHWQDYPILEDWLPGM
jgi:D-alanyl-D-alanine dipeptidase